MPMTKTKPAATAEAPIAETKAAPVADIASGISKASETKVDSGTSAAVERLQKSAKKETSGSSYSGRDFAAEARGKTRCVQFEAALMSPAIAGMKFKNIDEYLVLVSKAADYGVAYTFDELPKK